MKRSIITRAILQYLQLAPFLKFLYYYLIHPMKRFQTSKLFPPSFGRSDWIPGCGFTLGEYFQLPCHHHSRNHSPIAWPQAHLDLESATICEREIKLV